MKSLVHNLSAFGIDCIAAFDEPPLKLFNILTRDEYIEIWLSNNRGPVLCQLDARPGGELLIQGALCDRLVHTIRGTIVHSSSPMCFVIHCHERFRPKDIQRIAVTLQRSGALTHLRITHFGLRDIHEYKVVERFWRRAMDKMALLMQSRNPAPSFQPIWLDTAHRLERPWIPHAMSLEPAIHAREA